MQHVGSGVGFLGGDGQTRAPAGARQKKSRAGGGASATPLFPPRRPRRGIGCARPPRLSGMASWEGGGLGVPRTLPPRRCAWERGGGATGSEATEKGSTRASDDCLYGGSRHIWHQVQEVCFPFPLASEGCPHYDGNKMEFPRVHWPSHPRGLEARGEGVAARSLCCAAQAPTTRTTTSASAVAGRQGVFLGSLPGRRVAARGLRLPASARPRSLARPVPPPPRVRLFCSLPFPPPPPHPVSSQRPRSAPLAAADAPAPRLAAPARR